MRKRTLFVSVIVLIVLGIVFLRPGSSFRQGQSLKSIGKNVVAITDRIDRIESILNDSAPKINSLEKQLNIFENEVSEFFAKAERFHDRYSEASLDEHLGNFIEEFYRFDELFVSNVVPRTRGTIDTTRIQESLFTNIAPLGSLVSGSTFSEHFRGILGIEGYIYKEFRLSEIVNSIQSETISSDKDSSAARSVDPFTKIKEDFLLFFAGRLQGSSSTTVSSIEPYVVETPGDLIQRLALFDEVRENVLDSEVKTQLNIIRQQLIQRVNENIDREVAESAVESAGEIIETLKSEISAREGDVSRSVEQSLERAEFHLKQAESFKEKRNFGSAFGQATAASVAVRSVLLPLTVDLNEYRSDVEFLKQRFDQLVSLMSGSDVSSDEVNELIEEAEKEILRVSRLLETDTESNRTFVALKNLKILVGVLEQKVQEAISPIFKESQ